MHGLAVKSRALAQWDNDTSCQICQQRALNIHQDVPALTAMLSDPEVMKFSAPSGKIVGTAAPEPVSVYSRRYLARYSQVLAVVGVLTKPMKIALNNNRVPRNSEESSKS
ncbi:hypothetical protein C7H09_19335 [Marinobacter fuscus]|uniref:Uncharacterized protein n=1 Tax=Marinobacter fuscus TaxID=2109942 RepID=A0A2T1K364_9GAMM|nr:hypothetical protein C7H09_19335 [Marinobacter fuscus]